MSSRGRAWAGKPLTLVIGWILSCALVTGVTLTAVGRVGHEISGSEPQVNNQSQVNAKLSQVVAPLSASPDPVAGSPTPTLKPTPKPSTTGVPRPTTPVPPSPSPSHHASTTPAPTHKPTPSPTPSKSPVKASANPTTTPASSSPVASPTETAPSGSPVDSPTPSESPLASPTGKTGKSFETLPGGEIIIACEGDTVVQAAVVLSQGSKYTYTAKSTVDPKVDVVFTAPTGISTEYTYRCVDGQAVGGTLTPERTG